MREVLEKLSKGEITISEAEKKLKILQIQELGENIKFDDKRKDRTGIPEAVYSPGKTDEDLLMIINNLEISDNIMITRLNEDRFNKLKRKINESILENCSYSKMASILTIQKNEIKQLDGKVAILTAGTADITIAEEARITIEEAGFKTITNYDVGVAGIHRLINIITKIIEEKVDVVITVAGMEGSLPSVVAGLIDMPIIAVPTSTGYGVGKDGFTALFSMLQSCAPGITCTNIDNGYGAGVYAITILNQINKRLNEGY